VSTRNSASVTAGDRPVVLRAECILTMDDRQPTASYVRVEGERIIEVGQGEPDLGDAVVVDFGQRTLMPGFIDPHVHAEILSTAVYAAVGVHGPECASIDDIVEKLRANVDAAARRGGWLVGDGNMAQELRLEDGRLPTRDDLDRVSRSLPVAVRFGHTTALNSKALELAGLGETGKARSVLFPGSAMVDLDDDGKPNGLARELFYDLPIPTPSHDELKETLRNGMHEAFTRFGVTAVGEVPRTWQALEAMDELMASDELAVRVDAFPRVGTMGPIDEIVDRTVSWRGRAPAERLGLVGIKIFADGGLSGTTAATLHPYRIGRRSRGRLNFRATALTSMLTSIYAAGLQPMVHTVGERAQLAIGAVLDGLRGDRAAGALPLRLEHAGNYFSEPRLMDLWLRDDLEIVPNVTMLYSLGPAMARYLGERGVRRRFPLSTLIEKRGRLTVGSDSIGDERGVTNPFFGIWCATERRAWSGELVDPAEAITVEQGLRLHTIWAAEALNRADSLGSLAPGKLADVVALDRDPRALRGDELRAVNVDWVMSNGAEAHRREAARPIGVMELAP
jgi:predicted amidohydrolase YtcJ